MTVPLRSLSGKVNVEVEILRLTETGAEEPLSGVMGITVDASRGQVRNSIPLAAGAYICRVRALEEASGRPFGETVRFEVR